MPRFLIAALAVLTAATNSFGQGLIPSAGPINSSMAGASTLLRSISGSYWNPAAISGLDGDEFLLGSGVIIPSNSLQRTTFPAGSIGGSFPTTDRPAAEERRRRRLEPGHGRLVPPLRGLLDQFGLGIFGLAGGGVNFRRQQSQPLLTPRKPPKPSASGQSTRTTRSSRSRRLASIRRPTSWPSPPGRSRTGAALLSGVLRPQPEGYLRPFQLPECDQRPAVLGRGFQIGLLYNLNTLELRLLIQEPDLAGAVGVQLVGPDLAARRIGVQAQVPEIISWGIAYKGFQQGPDRRRPPLPRLRQYHPFGPSHSTAAWAGAASSPWPSAASTRPPRS